MIDLIPEITVFFHNLPVIFDEKTGQFRAGEAPKGNKLNDYLNNKRFEGHFRASQHAETSGYIGFVCDVARSLGSSTTRAQSLKRSRREALDWVWLLRDDGAAS
ncbi:MAG TPA: hypothetical protein VKR52_05380 [Terracidiphilus sp.]|nr:hypothetical protein [Terracidiphilus sp.]